MVDLSRRQLLALAGGGTVAAAGGAYVLLRESSQSSTVPYRRWVPAEGELERQEGVLVAHYDFERLRTHDSAPSMDVDDFLANELGFVDTFVADTRQITGLSEFLAGSGVYHGSFDPGRVVSRITASERYERRGEIEGFRVIEEISSGQHWAVNDEALVYANFESHLETLLRTKAGQRPRATNTDPYGAVVEKIGDGTSLHVTKYQEPPSATRAKPDGLVVSGERLAMGDSTTTFEFVYYLDHEPAQSAVATLRRAIERRSVSTVSVSREDRQVIASGEFETAALTRDLVTFPTDSTLVFPLPGDEAAQGSVSG